MLLAPRLFSGVNMPAPIADRTRAYKKESAGTGGNPNQRRAYPVVLNPQEDGLDMAALYLQQSNSDDEQVAIWRENGELHFRDTKLGANVSFTLSSLATTVLTSDSEHGNRGGGSLHALATTSVHGFMASTDKDRLDKLWNTTADLYLPLTGGTLSGNLVMSGSSEIRLSGNGILRFDGSAQYRIMGKDLRTSQGLPAPARVTNANRLDIIGSNSNAAGVTIGNTNAPPALEIGSNLVYVGGTLEVSGNTETLSRLIARDRIELFTAGNSIGFSGSSNLYSIGHNYRQHQSAPTGHITGNTLDIIGPNTANTDGITLGALGRVPSLEITPWDVYVSRDLSVGRNIQVAQNLTVSGTASASGRNLASEDYVQSRGMNLVTNGYGLLGDNTNWSQVDFDGTDKPPPGAGSFRAEVGVHPVTVLSDEYIPFDVSKRHVLQAWFKGTPLHPGARAFLGLSLYDIDKLSISNFHRRVREGTATRLAQPLAPGDTEVYLEDAPTDWYVGSASQSRIVTVFSYKNSYGYKYPDYTYSRYTTANGGYPEVGGVDVANKKINLTNPWQFHNPDDPNGVFPVGTAVCNAIGGDSYSYRIFSNRDIPEDWELWSGEVPANALEDAVAFAKIQILVNRNLGGGGTGTATSFAGVWFGEADYVSASDGGNFSSPVSIQGYNIWHAGNFNPATKSDTDHTHVVADVADLQSLLDDKANASHTHSIGQVTGLQTALDGKANSSHAHTIANVTGLQTALDSKASSIHSHAISDVTGLQTALDGKASTNHDHDSTYLKLTGGTLTGNLKVQGDVEANDLYGDVYADRVSATLSVDTDRLTTSYFTPPSSAGTPSAGPGQSANDVVLDITNNKWYRYTGSSFVEIGGGSGYVLPAASTTVRGGIRVGSNLKITSTDVLSLSTEIASLKSIQFVDGPESALIEMIDVDGAGLLRVDVDRAGFLGTVSARRLQVNEEADFFGPVDFKDDVVISGGEISFHPAVGGGITSALHSDGGFLQIPTNAGTPSHVAGTPAGRLVWNTSGNLLYVSSGSSWVAQVPSTRTITTSASSGLTGGGTLSSNRSLAINFAPSGTSSTTQAVRADDVRLSDARTPLAHNHTISDIADLQGVLDNLSFSRAQTIFTINPTPDGFRWEFANDPDEFMSSEMYRVKANLAGATYVRLSAHIESHSFTEAVLAVEVSDDGGNNWYSLSVNPSFGYSGPDLWLEIGGASSENALVGGDPNLLTSNWQELEQTFAHGEIWLRLIAYQTTGGGSGQTDVILGTIKLEAVYGDVEK